MERKTGHLDQTYYSRFGGGRRSHGSPCIVRGFRVNTRRFSVRRLRSKFLGLFRMLNMHAWRCRYGRALRALKRRICSRSNAYTRPSSSSSSTCPCSCLKRNSSSQRILVAAADDYSVSYLSTSSCRMKSFTRSNSFYSEAIADCLEFIKRSSVAMVDERRESAVICT